MYEGVVSVPVLSSERKKQKTVKIPMNGVL